MSTLHLNPAIAARRRAGKAAPPIVAPERTVQAVGGLLKTEDTPATDSPNLGGPNKKAAKKAGMRNLSRRLKLIWPHLFAHDDVPLAIGIRFAIAPHLSEEERQWLPAVLHQHVHRPRYLAALQQPGAHRVGLDGTITPVTPEPASRTSQPPPSCRPSSGWPA